MTFEQVAETPGHQMIHVFGVVHKLGPIQIVTLKNGILKQRRNILLVDQTKFSIVASIWQSEDKEIPGKDAKIGDVIVLLNAKASDYHGKSINLSDDSKVFLNQL